MTGHTLARLFGGRKLARLDTKACRRHGESRKASPIMKSQMKSTSSGGSVIVDLHAYGRWEIIVPWEIATEGWRREKGGEPQCEDDLKEWLRRGMHRFTDMLAARIDPLHVANAPDDPRIIMNRIG